jgi:spermidine/putrescine transport system permease protein
MVILSSFNASKNRAFWHGWSLIWYKTLFRDSQILQAAANSFIIAICAAFISAILGTFACLGIVKIKKNFYNFVVNLTNLPMICPEIVTGISSMLFFVFIFRMTGFLKPGILTLILTHSTFCTPYVFLSILPKIRQITPQIPEAAQDLGCTHVQAFFKVIMPQIMPGIITGIIIAFTMSIDDFTISYFTCGNIQTLPLVIYSMTRRTISPEINAISSVLFIIVFILLAGINIRSKNFLT